MKAAYTLALLGRGSHPWYPEEYRTAEVESWLSKLQVAYQFTGGSIEILSNWLIVLEGTLGSIVWSR